ncbi:UDP-2,3-diacetamido-2,3-dideoxy-D-glucuronic acid 2-epimerase (EC [Olavius sp. associated proteobacterium Delta 1]|nr:UDP-2,3-diacetamido-2,3-dideoxy-D-glucuronic acid 2-epimerase (EC [Olavius sp. associated proteobacterium Delta 1]
MKIALIVGARPQFIKLGPLSKKIKDHFKVVIVHTGQHFDNNMSDLFFKDLSIPAPHYNLGINSGLHGEQTGKMLIELEKVLKSECPSLGIVFGDTNSTLAGSLVCSKLHIPIIHIEAGLRSFNKEMPEEINRIVSDHTSDFLFSPTETAMQNLEREGLIEKALLTGDIMVDSLLDNIERADQLSNIVEAKGLVPEKYYLMTLHRPYNVDNPVMLSKILTKLSKIGSQIIFPVHPRTSKVMDDNALVIPENILLSDPVGYLDFIKLESFSIKIITDSGGIQKEAYILRKPCITIRPETEWIETVKEGWNVLVDVGSDDFVNTIETFKPSQEQNDLFGKNVAQKMFDKIQKIM